MSEESDKMHHSTQKSEPFQGYFEEFGLLDLFAFIWSNKLTLILSVTFTSFCFFVIWLFKQNLNSMEKEKGMFRTYLFQTSDEFEIKAPYIPQLLNDFLKLQDGAEGLYEGLNSVVDNKFSVTEWSDLQNRSKGVVRNVEIVGKYLEVDVALPNFWDEKKGALALETGLNSTIQLFNDTYDLQSLPLKRSKIELQIGEIKLQAIKSLSTDREINSEVRKSLIDYLNFSNSNPNKPDAFLVILATIPDGNPTKLELIRRYKELSDQFDQLTFQSKAISKTFGFENVSAIPNFKILRVKDAFMDSNFKSKKTIFDRLYVMLCLGLIFGTILGFTLAIVHRYWTTNRENIKKILVSKEN